NIHEFPRNNRVPIANAGVDRTSSTHALVILDGTGSFDADGDPVTFEWVSTVRPINSDGAITGPTTPTPSFTPDLPGNYTATLVVRDNSGAASLPDAVTINAIVTNRAPVFVSAPITAALTTQPYRYDAHAVDPDADILLYSLTTAPAGMTIDPGTGAIAWTPSADQGGQQPVGVRVQDPQGLFAIHSFVIQVASSGNGIPVATDDEYSVRVGESLSVAAPGVTANDIDESPLAARLVAPPGNGTVLVGADGSFTYTPHTLQPGEFVMAQNVNLAARMPGVVPSGGGCPRCAIDEAIHPDWGYGGSTLLLTFPSDITVSRVQIVGIRHANSPKISSGKLQLESSSGAVIFDSGFVELPAPNHDGTFIIPNLSDVRRVRFIPAATTPFFAALAEVRVIGSGLIQRTVFDEPNLVQLLPATVRSSGVQGFNIAEALIDESPANWFSPSNPGDFIEVTFPRDVMVRELIAANPNGRPDGFGTSNGMLCRGTFTFLDANRAVLFDSGLVDEPSGFLHHSDTFTLTVPDLERVRHVRYTLSGCTAGFGLGFSEWRILGSADVSRPAFSLAEKFQSLQRREAHSTPIVVNLTDDNGDGLIDANDIPDIAVPVEAIGDQLRGEIKVISGDDGRELFTAGGPDLVSPWSELAAGDIDGDGQPEILAVSSAGNRLLAFEHDGTLKWQSSVNAMPSFAIGASTLWTGAIAIANLDQTGGPEIIVGASVFAADGTLIGDGRTLGGTTGGNGLRSAISAIGDIDLDGTPEIVAGPTAYRLTGGVLTRIWQRTDRQDALVAIANLDDDPQAEIVGVANGSVWVLNHDGSDFQPWNAPSHAPVAIPGGGQGGAPLVVDVDGDGRPEIGVAGAANFVVFNVDGTVRWNAGISDRSSNSTGAVAFDLNGDGETEIIYRDERFLRIYRGADGALLAKTPVGSATWAEQPVVADVDNDGHADLVVSSDFFQQSSEDTGILVLQDAANKWKRTRRIWNQHAYHVTNVNEDGTIPERESPHWLAPVLNAFRTNAFVPDESEDETDSFTYVASDGVLESTAATVRIALRTPNAAPQFTSTPIATAARGVVYSYAAQAVDPDAGDILTFSLPGAPAGMTIDAGSGLISWTPADAQLGPHSIVVKAADVRGLFALQHFTLVAGEPSSVPDVLGQPEAAGTAAIDAAGFSVGAITRRHTATVPTGAILDQHPAGGATAAPGASVNIVVSLGPPPVGVVPAVVGLTQSSAEADVTAAGFTASVAAANSSTIAAGIVLSQSPAAGTTATAGSAVALVVSLGPPPGELDLDQDGFTGDQGDCNDTNPAINPAALDIPGDGIDQNCNGVDSITGDNTHPVAIIDSPEEDLALTMPTDIAGTATDANFLRYQLQLAAADETAYLTIASGDAPVDGGVLGQIDPTRLENGL
ncbi:MAG TPA: FG-GAP-like repeat-containing protein, partial [Vicinamibacterales bacterium]